LGGKGAYVEIAAIPITEIHSGPTFTAYHSIDRVCAVPRIAYPYSFWDEKGAYVETAAIRTT
jgi:hypothetical protein